MICGVFLCLLIMVKEEWKVVKGFEDYQVSSLGRVKSLKFNKERILKGGLISSGYYIVILRNRKISKGFLIHQLVAMTFLGHTPNIKETVIDHIDDDKTNNKLNNLHIVTPRFNVCKTQGKYTSNFKGVSWVDSRGKWLSQIRINDIVYNLGRFNTELEASKAYQDKIKTL